MPWCLNISDTTELFVEQTSFSERNQDTPISNEHNVLVLNTIFATTCWCTRRRRTSLRTSRPVDLWKWWEDVISTLCRWNSFITIRTCSDNTEKEWSFWTCIKKKLVMHSEQHERLPTATSYWMKMFQLNALKPCTLLRRPNGSSLFHQQLLQFTISLMDLMMPKLYVHILADATTWRDLSVLKTLTLRWKDELLRLGSITSKISDTPEYLETRQYQHPPKHRRRKQKEERTRRRWLTQWFRTWLRQSMKKLRRFNPRRDQDQREILLSFQKMLRKAKRRRNHHRNVPRPSCLLHSLEQSNKPPIQRWSLNQCSMKVLLRHRRGQLLRGQWNKKRRRQGKKNLAEALHHHQQELQFRFRLQHQKENHNNQNFHHHLTDQNNRIIHLQVWRIFQIYQLHQHHLDMKDLDDALMCLVIFTRKWQDPIQRIHEHHCRDTGQNNLKKKMKENVTLLNWNITTIPTLMPTWQSWMKLNILCQIHKKPRGKEQSFGTGWRISQSQESLQDPVCWIVWSRRVETRLRSPNTHIFHEQSQHRLHILNAKIPAKPVQSFVRTSWWRSKTTNSTGMCSTRWETLVATALRGVLCCQTILETALLKNTMSTLFTLLWQF